MFRTIRRILEVVHTVGDGAFIIMGELDEQVVAGVHLGLDRGPIGGAGVETPGVGSGLATVIDSNECRIEERTEVHTPAPLVRRTLIVLRHRGVSDGVYFDGTLHHRQAEHHGYEKRKDFSHVN